MAKINLIVTVLTFIGFALNLTCYPIFNTEIIYWFGAILNTLGTIFSIILFIKAGCIQGVWYLERYEEDDKLD